MHNMTPFLPVHLYIYSGYIHNSNTRTSVVYELKDWLRLTLKGNPRLRRNIPPTARKSSPLGTNLHQTRSYAILLLLLLGLFLFPVLGVRVHGSFDLFAVPRRDVRFTYVAEYTAVHGSCLFLFFFRGVRIWDVGRLRCHEFRNAWLADDMAAGFGHFVRC